MSMVNKVAALLNIDVNELINADIITASIRPFIPVKQKDWCKRKVRYLIMAFPEDLFIVFLQLLSVCTVQYQ